MMSARTYRTSKKIIYPPSVSAEIFDSLNIERANRRCTKNFSLEKPNKAERDTLAKVRSSYEQCVTLVSGLCVTVPNEEEPQWIDQTLK